MSDINKPLYMMVLELDDGSKGEMYIEASNENEACQHCRLLRKDNAKIIDIVKIG